MGSTTYQLVQDFFHQPYVQLPVVLNLQWNSDLAEASQQSAQSFALAMAIRSHDLRRGSERSFQ